MLSLWNQSRSKDRQLMTFFLKVERAVEDRPFMECLTEQLSRHLNNVTPSSLKTIPNYSRAWGSFPQAFSAPAPSERSQSALAGLCGFPLTGQHVGLPLVTSGPRERFLLTLLQITFEDPNPDSWECHKCPSEFMFRSILYMVGSSKQHSC